MTEPAQSCSNCQKIKNGVSHSIFWARSGKYISIQKNKVQIESVKKKERNNTYAKLYSLFWPPVPKNKMRASSKIVHELFNEFAMMANKK